MKPWKSFPSMLALTLALASLSALGGCEWMDGMAGGGTEVNGVTGTVVDAGGAPVQNVLVRVFPESQAPAKRAAAQAAIEDSARTDANGRYRIDSLPAGEYVLLAGIVRHDTALTVLVRGIVHDGGRRDLGEIVLLPGGSLSITVFSASGQPAAGARCVIAGLEVFQATSDAAGRCVVKALPEGSFRINVSHPVLGSGQSGTVRVRPGRTVNAGEVELDGEPPVDTTDTDPDPDPDPGVDSSLLAAFSFSEGTGTSAASTGRSGAIATLMNGASFTSSGAIGSALSLTGSGQHAYAPNSPLLSGMSELTVEAWVYPTSAPTALQRIAAVWGPLSTQDDSWSFSITAAGRVTLEVNNASDSWDKSAIGNTSVTLNQWNHIVGVYSSGAIRLYLNGAQVYSGTSVTGPLKSVSRPLEIGAVLSSSGAASGSWPGRIDEVRIHDKARTAAQIQASYQAGPQIVTPPGPDTALANASYFGVTSSTVAVWNFNGLDASNRALDLSGKNLHLTRTGSPTLEASPHGSAAVFAGGVSQRFQVPYDNRMTIASTGRLTMEARIYITGYTPNSSFAGRGFIMGAYAGPALKLFNDGRFEILYQRNKNGSDYWYSAWTMPAAVPLNRWVNIAVAIDNTVTPQQFYAYVDGVPVQLYAADNVASNSDPFRVNYQAPFSVGGGASDSEHFQGKIEEARFSNALVLGPGLPTKDGSEGAPRPAEP